MKKIHAVKIMYYFSFHSSCKKNQFVEAHNFGTFHQNKKTFMKCKNYDLVLVRPAHDLRVTLPPGTFTPPLGSIQYISLITPL